VEIGKLTRNKESLELANINYQLKLQFFFKYVLKMKFFFNLYDLIEHLNKFFNRK